MQIIDDFLPLEHYQSLRRLCTSIDFDWHLELNAASQPEHSVAHGRPSAGWVHLLANTDYNLRSWALEPFGLLLAPLRQLTNQRVVRARATCLTSRWGAGPGDYLTPHVDYMNPHTTALYYLDSADGDTVFFNQRYQGGLQPQEFSVASRLAPRANRLVVFDGLQYHTATAPCSSELRMVVNVNLFD